MGNYQTRRTISPPRCPVEALLQLLTGPWTIHILWVLQQRGPLRFGALRRAVGHVSAKVLTQRLRLLEKEGLIYRDYVPTIPPQVTYGLTARGEELGEVVEGLEAVARRWRAAEGEAGSGTGLAAE